MSEEWGDPGRVAEYLSREISHRAIAEEMLLEALPSRIERVLDLGTGDGRLLAVIRDRHPDALAVGIDTSSRCSPMPSTDSKPIPWWSSALTTWRFRFQIWDPSTPWCPAWQFTTLRMSASGNCLKKIHILLTPGGIFANLDLVASASSRLHERFRREIGRTQDDPTDECWRPAFARYLQPRLSGLRRELDTYLNFYNHDRVHHGRLTDGQIPADIVYGARKMEVR